MGCVLFTCLDNSSVILCEMWLTVCYFQLGSDMCGPWIPDGGVFTHTAALASPIEPWTTNVILTEDGPNFIIAHIRIGAIQMALGHKMHVFPKPSNDLFVTIETVNSSITFRL